MKAYPLLVLTALSTLLMAGHGGEEELRYVDRGDGTVGDTVTGLIWLKEADCFGRKDFRDALCAAVQLKQGDCGLSDGSAEGSWRLPTRAEWKAMTKDGCIPSISDDTGSGCSSSQSSFTGVQSAFYWSSTTSPYSSKGAWVVSLGGGHFGVDGKGHHAYVWPVRGGGSPSEGP